ncbi:SLAM family member 8-like [Phaenicophaeus curvirostris]|uniref:SLAM family member 8-like n=1 Tax=Phaenicophaeus curvirostris TaxID=33595 RepID=UPI0037F0F96E
MGTASGPPWPRGHWLLATLFVVAAQEQPQHVNGALGGSVLLAPALPPNKTVKKIEWTFSDGTGNTIQVAEFGAGGFKRPDPKDRFKDRLEMFNKTMLKIRALERGDTGVYGARIKLHPALVEDQSFNLSVYGPVPVPEIQAQHLSMSTQGCNLTLRCWVPAGTGAEATWQLSSILGTPWGQLCWDKQTLCLSVPTSAFNSSYTCLAHNPLEEQNVTVRVDTLCRHLDRGGWWRWHVCWMVVALGAGALLGLLWLWRKKRRKKTDKGAALTPLSSEEAPPELLYAEIQSRPGGQERRNPPTIYSQVQLLS